MTRRNAMGTLVMGAASAFVAESLGQRLQASEDALPAGAKGRINHSACRWCYKDTPIEELCRFGKEIGLKGIDLVDPKDWKTVHNAGLEVSLGFSQPAGYGIVKGFNRLENHALLLDFYRHLIPQAADNGIKQLICFSGNRGGLDDEQGIKNCAEGLRALMPLAEKHGVIITMELLNSKVNHPDYQCDHTNWGVELCKEVGSDQFKLLYDIYHMQIMEGDVIRTIRDNAKYISHYHTGGVPGRHEIDDSQELYYPAIMQAIADLGFSGFVAQEFIPASQNKLESLEKCVRICDV